MPSEGYVRGRRLVPRTDGGQCLGVHSCEELQGQRKETRHEPEEGDVDEEEIEGDAAAPEPVDENIEPERSDDEVRDEINGQKRIF